MIEPRYLYTVQQYWTIVRVDPHRHKYEYADEHIRVIGKETDAHEEIRLTLSTLFKAALQDRDCHVYNSDAAVLVDREHIYHPDISVSCKPYDQTNDKGIEAPIVVVEVLSPTTEEVDIVEKLPAYLDVLTIQELLLVDSQKKHVLHYHRLAPNKWLTPDYEHDNDLIEMASIDVSFTIRDIYHRIHFE